MAETKKKRVNTLEELLTELDNLRDSIDKKTIKIKNEDIAIKEIFNMRDRLTELEQLNAEKEMKIVELEGRLSIKAKEMEEFRNAYKALEENYAVTSGINDKLEEKCRNLEEELRKTEAVADVNKTGYDSCSIDIKKYTQKIGELTAENTRLEAKNEKLISENMQLGDKLAKLADENVQLKNGEKRTPDLNYTKLMRVYRIITENIEATQETLKEREAEIKVRETILESRVRHPEFNKTDIENIKADIIIRKEDLEALKAELEEHYANLKVVEADLDAYYNKHPEIRERIQSSQIYISLYNKYQMALKDLAKYRDKCISMGDKLSAGLANEKYKTAVGLLAKDLILATRKNMSYNAAVKELLSSVGRMSPVDINAYGLNTVVGLFAAIEDSNSKALVNFNVDTAAFEKKYGVEFELSWLPSCPNTNEQIAYLANQLGISETNMKYIAELFKKL